MRAPARFAPPRALLGLRTPVGGVGPGEALGLRAGGADGSRHVGVSLGLGRGGGGVLAPGVWFPKAPGVGGEAARGARRASPRL